MIDFCISKNIGIFFNNVRGISSETNKMYSNLYENGTLISDKHKTLSEEYIKEFRLWTLPQEKKQEIKDFLLKRTYPPQFQEQVDSFINYLMNYKWFYDPVTKEQ